jgi:hypothetical protein
VPAPCFDHLRRLTTHQGLWEHALLSTPRVEHGFCLDDNARALVVSCHQVTGSSDLADLAATYLGFTLEARTTGGGFHNRRSADGSWLDTVGTGDSQGRAWWGLGAAARGAPVDRMRQAGAEAFEQCASFESEHLRSNAYAVLGCVELLEAFPDHDAAAALLRRAAGAIRDAAQTRIPWLEPRLTYDNARLPQALLAAGAALSDRRMTAVGLRLLDWLVGAETNDNHFSFTPAGGSSTDERGSRFDQQPIEAWGMADACLEAWRSTGDPVWKARTVRAARWLLGANDTGEIVYRADTGATGDGLTEHSVNQNQGAESTIAGIGALQAAAALQALPRETATT